MDVMDKTLNVSAIVFATLRNQLACHLCLEAAVWIRLLWRINHR
ncbi:hypothetical protein ALP99_101977 [Pseudomonas syringae pv. tomato]|uniref:Uncharacterized protein n=1 Tax=Pseudomonas syringae pv. tagetis TaxID=129140 RepID=A0A3M3YW13_9PSED|nr:Unknown protein sequence [Pseudomonas syringae pv. maculicola str. M6]KPB88543.1 Unknown protein sequence [Pseudomonas syringae pv. maculicola]KPC08477.1 Unknown protein sequence [Pseudomonas amygdali pv. lachrymans]KPW53727.1 hypothetical protein ALO86_101675 [Pseudomonas syringae pv. berberidis]KPY10390.1 hypothetical protein ALO54_101879 [Pseudomonas syringae pv. philadelphi]RMO86750.1 hypothetical protein ALQ32_101757 [Pseudomonas syringae pv. tagetis]RMQ72472.1 hypothetical protein AL